MASYPDTSRKPGSLKRKFQLLYTSKKPTGDPDCPPQVRRAKWIWKTIKGKMGVASLGGDSKEDDYDDDDNEEEKEDMPEVPAVPTMNQQGNNNQQANSDVSDVSVACEQPDREQPACEQPACEQPAREQPARERPAREQPASIPTHRVARASSRAAASHASPSSEMAELMNFLIGREEAEKAREN